MGFFKNDFDEAAMAEQRARLGEVTMPQARVALFVCCGV